MRIPSVLRLLVCAILVLLSVALPAQAARIPAILNIGYEVFKVGPLPASMQRPELARVPDVAYECQHVGLFWADILVWDCRMILVVSETEAFRLPEVLAVELQKDERYQFSHAERSLWNKYGFWSPFIAIGAILVLLFLLALFQAVRRAVSEKA